MSLFLGFIISTLHSGIIIIDHCIFIAKNKTIGLNYHEVLLIDSPVAKVFNSFFEGLECVNFPSIEHTHGVLNLQAESSYLRRGNQKNATISNLTFYDCECENAGSIGFMNFFHVNISKIFINKTKAIFEGGAIEIISYPYVYAEDLTIISTFS